MATWYPTQDLCVKAAAANHKFFVKKQKKDTNTFEFSSFDDATSFYDDYYEKYCDKRRFHEWNVSFNNDRLNSRLYMDIEWTVDTRDSDCLVRVGSVLKPVLTKLSYERMFLDLPIILDFSRVLSDGKYKHSYHVHFPNTVFKHNKLAGEWLKHVFRSTLRAENNWPLILDGKVYDHGRSLRLPGSSKEYYDDRGFCVDFSVLDYKVGSDFTLKFTTTHQHSFPTRGLFLDCCMTTTDEPNMDVVSEVVRESQSIQQEGGHVVAITAMLRAKGDFSTTVHFNGTRYSGRNGNAGRTCLLDPTHVHIHNNCGFSISNKGSVYYHCFSGKHEGRKKSMPIGSISVREHLPPPVVEVPSECRKKSMPIGSIPVRQPLPPPPPPISAAAAVVPSEEDVDRGSWDERVLIRTRKLGRVHAIHPFHPVRKCYVVKANMCTKKTRRTVEYIRTLGEDTRILVISTRITLSLKQKHDFEGFSHYQDKDFDVKANRVIIGYESLRRLCLQQMQPFDCIILDEMRSLLSNVCCLDTNKRYLEHNFNLLQKFLRASRQVIVLDADLEVDDSCRTFLEDTIDPSEIELHRYSGQPPNMQRTMAFTTDETSWFESVESCVQQGLSCCIKFRSKQRMHIVDQYLKKLGFNNTVTVSADTDGTEIKEIFEDIDAHLIDRPCFLFTSKLNVGVSIERVQYDRMFVDAKANSNGTGGAVPRSMIQGTGRFRSLACNRIECLMDSLSEKSNGDLMQQIENTHVERIDMCEEYRQFLFTSRFERDFGLKFSPTTLGKLFSLEQFEQRRDYVSAMFDQLRQKGWTLEFCGVQTRPFERLKELSTELKEKKIENEKAVFEEVRQHECITDLIFDCDNLVKSHSDERNTKLKLQMAHVLKHFRRYVETNEWDHSWSKPNIENYADYKLAEKSLNTIRNMATEDLIVQEKRAALTYSCADLTLNMRSMQSQAIDECLELLEVDRTDEGGMFIEKSSFEIHEAKVLELCRKSAIARDPTGGYSKPTGKKPGQRAISSLRRELYAVRGMKLEPCSKTVNEDGKRTVSRYKVSIDDDLARLANLSNFNVWAREDREELDEIILERKYEKEPCGARYYIRRVVIPDLKRRKLITEESCPSDRELLEVLEKIE